MCHNTTADTWATCVGNQCCDNATAPQTCKNPCANPSNPCTTFPSYRCTTQCAVSGSDYTCSDPCNGVNCSSSTTQRNPDCQRNTDGSSTCVCAAASRACTATECCEGSGCITPCAPTNPCTTAPNYRCNIDCTQGTNDYTCSDPCAGNPCSEPTPTCVAQSNGSYICGCNGSGCTGANPCCVNGNTTCNPDVCSPNPCAVTENCIKDCSQNMGYRCQSKCLGVSCSEPNPTCNPNDGVCKCNGTTCSGAAPCCVSGNTTCNSNVCSPNPCASQPTNKRCVADCTQDIGYRCENYCAGVSCSEPTPTCDVTDGICKCNGAACSGTNACCVSSNTTCTADVCSPNPCTGANKKCVKDCTQDMGYRCDNFCAGVNCSEPTPTCDPTDGVCKCAGASCSGTNACCVSSDSTCDTDVCSPDPCASDPTNKKCVKDCTQDMGYRCDDYCASATCTSPLVCNHANGHCACGTAQTECAGQPCCSNGSGDYFCNTPVCTPTSCPPLHSGNPNWFCNVCATVAPGCDCNSGCGG